MYLFCLHRKTQTMKWRNTCVRTFIFRTRSVTVTAEAQSCFRQFICPFVRLCVAVGGPGRSVAVGPLQGRGGEERRTRRSRTHRGSDPEHLCSSFPPGAGDKIIFTVGSKMSLILYSIEVLMSWYIWDPLDQCSYCASLKYSDTFYCLKRLNNLN